MGRTPKQLLHDKAMQVASSALHKAGHSVSTMKETWSPFDLLVNGKIKCEVKGAAMPQPVNGGTLHGWQFNLHRHGVIPNHQADLYWLYLSGVPGFKNGISLIMPHSELRGKHTLVLTLRRLLTRYAKWYMRMDLFKDFS